MQIRVLLIEDNPGDVRLMRELLRDITSIPIQLESVDCLTAGLKYLRQHRTDIILLDLFLPDGQGLATFAQVYQQERDIPIIVTTGLQDEALALKAVQDGAQDYLVKGQITGELMVRSMCYAIERKRAEQKIREQAALLDITTDAILVRNIDHYILFWNKGAERLYGWTAEEVMGEKASDLLYTSTSVQFQAAQQELMQKNEWQGELNQATKTGQAIVVESRWTLVRDTDGQPKFVLIVSTDITKKKQLEAQFSRAQRLESIGTLASGIAHDLNNILTPILAIAQLLQMKLVNLDERSLQMLKLVEANAKRGGELVKQVLLFSRGVEGEQAILQIKHLIREIQQILRETFPKSITVQIDIPDDLWPITGNMTQLHQVLMNLCVNARDAMPAGGVLTIEAKCVTINAEYARMNLDAKEGKYIAITVADSGVGIPVGLQDRIFEPFFTTKEVGKGTGLGLSTAFGIVKSHQGFIQTSSTPGKGTRFTVFLPAVMETSQLDISTSELFAGHQELILIVDDEAPIREMMKSSLETYNYRVLTAADGVEAIALYAQNQHDIDLVILDMMMPLIDGSTIIRTLQKMNPQLKLIIASGLPYHYESILGSHAGIQTVLAKPYTVADLIKAIHEALKPAQ